MNKGKEAAATAAKNQAAKAEGELRKAAVQAHKENGLPEDLIERVKKAHGVLFEYKEELANLSDADRATLRQALKQFVKDFPIGDFDKLTGAGASKDGDGKPGRPVQWDDPEPWPEAVDGAELLSGIAAFIKRYVSIAPTLADTVALWIAVTWIHDRLEISPFLNVTSATKRCGKSLLLEALGELVHHPLPVGGRVTSSALFRTIEMHAPTMLLDEADTFFGDDDELRGVVNGSQRRGSAYVMRCVGDDHEPRRFVTWCPKAIAGIGGLPDTVRDRSIVVKLTRRPPDVSLAHWRERDRTAIEDLRRMLAQWCGGEATNIVARLSAVSFPPGLHDRGRDAWEALLALGDMAGSGWSGRGGRAWKACEHVTASTADEETGAREMLLADLLTIFEAKGWPEAIATNQALDDLSAMEGRPWSEWKRGKPLSARGLSNLLKPFGVMPRQVKRDGNNQRSYLLSELRPHWDAYFPQATPCVSATPLPSPETSGFVRSQSATADLGVADADRTKPLETRQGSGVADRNRGARREDAAEPLMKPVPLPSQPPGTPTAGEAYRRAKDGE